VNHLLDQKETSKTAKHATHYDNIGFGFLPFVASCFGVLGQSAARLLMALASLQLRQHEARRASSGLDPLPDESARSQFRALCFRQSSARIGNAIASGTVQHLLAMPSLLLLRALPLHQLARNLPGPADFASHSLSSPPPFPALPLSTS
jgi:hypothetical protein